MNLIKRTREVKIEDKEYVMAFDMRSVAMFQEVTGQTFTNAMPQLFAGTDFIILGFLGATLRPKENPNAPIGKKVFEMDVLGLLLNQGKEVTALIADSLPNSKPQKGKK